MLNHHEPIANDARSKKDPATALSVVLLNPFPFDQRIWADNVPALRAAGHALWTCEYPGFAPAAAAPPAAALSQAALSQAALSIDGIADLLQAELRDRQVAPVILVGLSMGGYVALSVAIRFPKAVAALVLADTRAAGDSPATRAGRASALATLGDPAQGVSAYLASSLPRLLRPDAPAEVLARVRALAVDRAEALSAGIVALRDRPDRTAALATLRVPTLVVVGAEDTVSPPTEMRELAAAIPGAHFAPPIAGAGHLSNLEQPQTFNRLVIEFLDTLP